MNPSNGKIVSAKHQRISVCGSATNSNEDLSVRSTRTNEDCLKILHNEAAISADGSSPLNSKFVKDSAFPQVIPLDEENGDSSEKQKENGTSGFFSKKFGPSNEVHEKCGNNFVAVKGKICPPNENDSSNVLKCNQLMNTEKTGHSTSTYEVSLDEFDLSFSKILNSTKKSSKAKEDGAQSKIDAAKGDHTYHLPLPAVENGHHATAEKTKPENACDQGKLKVCSKPKLTSGRNCLVSSFNGGESETVTDTNQNLVQNLADSPSPVTADHGIDDEHKQPSNQGTYSTKVFFKDSDCKETSSVETNALSCRGNAEYNNDAETPTAENGGEHLISADKNAGSFLSGCKISGSAMYNNNMQGESAETSAPKVVSDSEISLPNENLDLRKGKKDEASVAYSSESQKNDECGSVKTEVENSTDKDSSTKDVKALTPDVEVSAETSYECNECGAKLKTQNSLFTHKKMHLSGVSATAIVLKRKYETLEKNQVSTEVKRKRGRPKLSKPEKSEKTGVTITPLKENVVKKVLRKRAQSVEVKQLKSKQKANEVKENKISNNGKIVKREKRQKLRKPVLAKVKVNNSKSMLKSGKCNNTSKDGTKVESAGVTKGKAKNFYSSSISGNLLRKFACSECGAKFKRNDHLKRHQLLHSEKTFQCRDCEMRFYRGDKLKLHTLRHHVKAPSASTKVNIKRVAVVKVTKLPKKSVECHKCGIQFLRILPPKTDKSGLSRRKNSCCISCGAKMQDENN